MKPFAYAFAALGLAAGPAAAEPFATPEEAFKGLAAAVEKRDGQALFACLTDDSQTLMAGQMVTAGVMMKAFAKGESDAEKALMKKLDDAFAKHGLGKEFFDKLKDGPPVPRGDGWEAGKKTIDELLKPVKDRAGLVADLMDVFLSDPAMKRDNPFAGQLQGLKVAGDTATGSIDHTKGADVRKQPVTFRKVEGGWKIDFVADDKTFAGGRPAVKLDKGLTAVGIAVVKQGAERPNGLYVGFDGTTVTVAASLPDVGILGVEAAASKLDSFADDKGTDLTKGPVGSFPREWVNPFPRIGKDRHLAAFELQANGTPAVGATKVKLKGTLTVTAGVGEKPAASAELEFKKGEAAKVGAVTLTVEEGFGGGQPYLKATAAEWTVKSIDFADADKKPVRTTGGPSPFKNVKGEMEMSYYPVGKVAGKVTAKVVAYEKVEGVKLPFDLEIGLRG